MGYYATEPAASRGVVFEKRAVRFCRGVHCPNSLSRLTNGPTSAAFRAAVLRTTAPGVPLYGYRHLSTELGRWVRMDPIEEVGFMIALPADVLARLLDESEAFSSSTAYVFCNNAPQTQYDFIGLAACINVSGNCKADDLKTLGFFYLPEDDTGGKILKPLTGTTCDIDGLYMCGAGKIIKVPNKWGSDGWIKIECKENDCPKSTDVTVTFGWKKKPLVWIGCKKKGPAWCPGIFPNDKVKKPEGWPDCPAPYLPF